MPAACATTLSADLQVEKLHEEDVQLKLLQTALTLMHSHRLAQNEVRAWAGSHVESRPAWLGLAKQPVQKESVPDNM